MLAESMQRACLVRCVLRVLYQGCPSQRHSMGDAVTQDIAGLCFHVCGLQF